MCPRRHFAKQEMIAATEIFVSMFDIEFQVPHGFIPEVDKSFVPIGTLLIKGKVPFRIRRRGTEE